MRLRNRMIALLMAAPVLSGCTSDPAFWDAVAEGLDQAAYDLATQPVCTWYTDRFGVVRQSCVPAYAANSVTYHDPAPRYRDRSDRRDRHDRRDRDRRGGGGRDHDDRRDRGDRRGPKG